MTLDHGVERLIVGNCLSPNVSRVLREDFPHETSEQMVFTVFTELGEDGVFCGLVTSQEIAQQPNLNFGNLIKNREIHAVPPDASVFQALNTMIQEKLSALPVLNKLNKLVGVITHQSVIQTLTQCEQDCQSELRNLRIQFEIQEQLAKTRLAQLNKTLEDLTTKQGLDLIEVNLLQLGIEALTTLLQVRYGAIGILDESDESGETHKYFGHTGITP
ncbi:MAG: CBS domain-containing protein, partial [Candidatus Planktophila sp.]|nr:CBS domain-containing protein [Candidatus Planktophila sp.]